MVRKNLLGQSLSELLAVLAVVSVLVSVAAPSFSHMLAEQRLRQVGSELRLSIATARSEAVKRNRSIALVKRGDAWSNGWCVDQESGSACSSAPLQVFALGSGEVSIARDGAVGGEAVEFNAWGRPRGCPTFTVSTSSSGGQCTVCLTLSADGRVSSHGGACSDSCDSRAEDMSWAGACS